MRCSLISGLLLLVLSHTTATAQEIACDVARLDEGTNSYDLGLFDAVISDLEPCLPRGFEEPVQQESAHRLVALSYLEQEDYSAADGWILSIFDINPRYQPPSSDEAENPLFYLKVQDLRPPKWHQRWLWRGVIAGAGAGTAAFFIFRPPESIPLKPLPPAAPGQ